MLLRIGTGGLGNCAFRSRDWRAIWRLSGPQACDERDADKYKPPYTISLIDMLDTKLQAVTAL
jgi:hypothetical protein